MRSSQGSSPDLDFSTISSISGNPCDVYFSRNFAHSRPTGSSDEPQFKAFDDVKILLDADDVVQDACITKLNELFTIDGNLKELYRVFSSLAIQPYESQSNHGKLAVVDEQNLDKSDIVKFEKPVTISNDSICQIRKILEMTKKEWNILVIDRKIMGLGKEIPFRGKICFTKPGCWNITIGNEVVFFAEGTRFSV